MANMPEKDIEIAKLLCEKDEGFKELWDEHQALKGLAKELSEKRFLTAADQAEVKRVKRLKLSGKDKIARKINEYKVSVSSSG